MSRTALGDERAVGAAYAAHGAELFRLAHRLLLDRSAAEDAVQETFVRAWRSSAHFDPARGSLRTRLFAIARNVCVDAAAARGRRPTPQAREVLTPLFVAEPADPFDAVLAGWLADEAARRLSAEHREALLQVHLLGRDYTDVAAELGIPESTLRSRVYYALRAARLALEEMGWTG
ncbi:sigma-70 family RNA polymerase sigma factor [Pseudonocardia sp.]|uniref:sigma-70 family RNA polymerase sigma factor n=1 Tax=Pseudonocardia sp. TaxID=60912 RepID=UPI003D145238